MSQDTYRRAMATKGLLAHVTAPKPDCPPLNEDQRQEAVWHYRLEIARRWVLEKPEIGAELKRLPKKKPGPNPKWGVLQKVALIVEVDSKLSKRLLTRRGSSPLPNETSITSVCKKLAREDHWKFFLGERVNRVQTLRKNYSSCHKDKKLKKLALYVMSLDVSGRESFVLNALAQIEMQRGDIKPGDEQSGGHELQRTMLDMVRGKG